MGSRETDGLATLEDLATILKRQQEAILAGNWEAFAEASREWEELMDRFDPKTVKDPETARNKLESLLAACNDLHAQVSGEMSRHAASLVSIRQHRHVLHSYGGLGLNTGVSYYIDEKK